MSSAASPATNPPQSPRSKGEDSRPAWQSVSRGVAIFWGLFILLQVVLWRDTYSLWWLGERPFSTSAQRALAALYSVLLLLYGWTEREPKPIRALTQIFTLILLMLSLYEVWCWYSAVQAGTIISPTTVPFALQIAGSLSVILAGLSQPAHFSGRDKHGFLWGMIAFDVCVLALPIVHLFCQGRTTDALVSKTVIVAVDRLSSPTAEELLSLKKYLSESEPVKILLLGSETHADDWRVAFASVPHEPPLSVSELPMGTNWKELHLKFSDIETDENSNSVLLVGAPSALPALRIHTLRAGLKPTQFVLDADQLSLQSAVLEVPDLWLTYLGLR